HCNNQQQHSDDDEVEDPSGGTLNRPRLCRMEIFRPHDSFGGEFVNPGEQHRDWKSHRERNDNKTHCRIWNFKKRKNLRCELREEPCDNSVSDRCAVNIAPLQLGQNILRIHSARLDEALLTAVILPVCAVHEKRLGVTANNATKKDSNSRGCGQRGGVNGWLVSCSAVIRRLDRSVIARVTNTSRK